MQWTPSEVHRLRALIAEGMTGQDIACHLSAEFGRAITALAVFKKARKLGLSVGGRSPGTLRDPAREDPFRAPSWLAAELARVMEETARKEQPYSYVFLNPDAPNYTKPTEATIQEYAAKGLRECWRAYVSDIVRNHGATRAQGRQAAAKTPPAWFRSWVKQATISAPSIGDEEPIFLETSAHTDQHLLNGDPLKHAQERLKTRFPLGDATPAQIKALWADWVDYHVAEGEVPLITPAEIEEIKQTPSSAFMRFGAGVWKHVSESAWETRQINATWGNP